MVCKNCKFIEMRVESVNEVNNTATHVCKKCGYTVTEDLPEEQRETE